MGAARTMLRRTVGLKSVWCSDMCRRFADFKQLGVSEEEQVGKFFHLPTCGNSGANERIRTADLRITSALLYQLSHVGETLLAKRLFSIANRARLRKRSGWIISLRLLAVPYGEKPLGDEVFQVRDYREESRVRRCAAGTARRGLDAAPRARRRPPGPGRSDMGDAGRR